MRILLLKNLDQITKDMKKSRNDRTRLKKHLKAHKEAHRLMNKLNGGWNLMTQEKIRSQELVKSGDLIIVDDHDAIVYYTWETFKNIVSGDLSILNKVSNIPAHLWKEIIDTNDEAIKYVPQDLLTKELIHQALNYSGNNIQYIPEQLGEYCKFAIEQYPPAIVHIKNQTVDWCLMAIDIVKVIDDHKLEYFTKELIKAIRIVPASDLETMRELLLKKKILLNVLSGNL